jgi:hypothetical protein
MPVEGHVIWYMGYIGWDTTHEGKRERREKWYTTYQPNEGMGRADSARMDVEICKTKGDLRASGGMGVAEG